MRLVEFDTSTIDTEELIALSQFLLARAEDTGAEKRISVSAFLKIAGDMGISFTKDQLLSQASLPPLNNLIANVEGDEIIFKGNETPDTTMSVSNAQNVVNTMSKRALNKRD
jgi:hypothetical protein